MEYLWKGKYYMYFIDLLGDKFFFCYFIFVLNGVVKGMI